MHHARANGPNTNAYIYRLNNTQCKRFTEGDMLHIMNLHTATVCTIDSKHRQIVVLMKVRSMACSGLLLALNEGGSPLL
jgi:hypothetical protein